MVVFPNRSAPDILCFWPQRLLRLTTRFSISRFGGFDVVFSYRSAPEIFVFAPSVFSLLLHAPNCLWIYALAPTNSNVPSAASAFASFHALIRGTFANVGDLFSLMILSHFYLFFKKKLYSLVGTSAQQTISLQGSILQIHSINGPKRASSFH
jgi:hypothetical protein